MIDDPPAGLPRTPLADPRVETLVAWTTERETPLDRRGWAALAALKDALPRPEAAAAIALAVAAAYARVPRSGPRDLGAGHALVELLARLGVPGARELVRLRERVRYHHALREINRTLERVQRELGIPLGELEDAFGGPELDANLALTLPVGPYEAVVRVSGDLRRVATAWRNGAGRELRTRPARVAEFPDALALVQRERRRVQAQVTNLRGRLDDAMRRGASWTLEQWATRMFADPLRAAMTRRLLWQFVGSQETVVALPADGGLVEVAGRRVEVPHDATVALWHPAEAPELQQDWQRLATAIELDQPVEQIWRDVTLADDWGLDVGAGAHLNQRAFRGFLMGRGWQVPYLGPFFAIAEATRELSPGGPTAVLQLQDELDERGRVVVVGLWFRSVLGRFSMPKRCRRRSSRTPPEMSSARWLPRNSRRARPPRVRARTSPSTGQHGVPRRPAPPCTPAPPRSGGT